MNSYGISIISNRTHVTLPAADILYVRLNGRKSAVHASGGRVYETYTPIDELARALGGTFIRVDRGCLVSARAVHAVGKTIELINGETLDYTRRRKREIMEQLRAGRRQIAHTMDSGAAPATAEDYRRHYASFAQMPFAFADIEMVFSGERLAVDWIFRYGNEARARLEGVPLEQLIDHSFASIFSNMDPKWLRAYERTALYGETWEITDYSPEINAELRILCFPTFAGHCGCILVDQSAVQLLSHGAPEGDEAQK